MKFAKLPFSFLLLCIFVVQVNSVLASHCFPMPPPCRAFWENDAVFVGVVTAMKNDYTFVLKVEKPYRGVKQDEEITINQSLGWCDHKFEVGKKYLVYANKSSNGETLSTLVDSIHLFSEELSTVKFFESLSDGKPEYSIWVVPSSKYFSPARLTQEHFRLEIWKAEERLKNEKNEFGLFIVPMPEAGKYKLRVFLPPNDRIIFTKPDEDIKVSFGRFAKQKFIETEISVEADKCGYFLVPLMLVEPD